MQEKVSASLVMPISDPRDRFFYPHHTHMKDTYIITHIVLYITSSKTYVLEDDLSISQSELTSFFSFLKKYVFEDNLTKY